MNKDTLERRWKRVKPEVRRMWSGLTNDEIDEIGGDREAFIQQLQERYGYSRIRAEQVLDKFIAGFNRAIGKSSD